METVVDASNALNTNAVRRHFDNGVVVSRKNIILAVDADAAFSNEQAAEWEKLGVSVQRVGTMHEAIAVLQLEGQYLFVAINEDSIPDFKTQLPDMRAQTGLPIFVVTSTYSAANKASVIHCGANSYDQFSKSAKENVDIAYELLRRCVSPDKLRLISLPVLIEGKIVLSPSRRMVWADDVPVDLTKMEFDVLEFFLYNHDVVLTYWQIFDHVWGHEYGDNAPRLVWYHVHSLRRHLERAAGLRGYIVNVKDIGYRFSVPNAIMKAQ